MKPTYQHAIFVAPEGKTVPIGGSTCGEKPTRVVLGSDALLSLEP